MQEAYERLRISLWVGIAVVLAAVLPFWPAGFFTLVRLVVCALCIYVIVASRGLDTPYTVALGFIALLFNPVIPVHLNKLLWVPIDLGVAYFFWRILEKGASVLEVGAAVDSRPSVDPE